MSRTIRAVLGIVVVLGVAAGAGAIPNIIVGTHTLNANQAGQTIEIYVTGGDDVQGLEFNVRIGEGVAGPIFEDVDIFTGAIFAGHEANHYTSSYVNDRDAYQGVTTTGGYVSAAGLLATLTIDTTGLYSGEYNMSLIDTVEGRTNFAGVYVDIADGSIIVPEPTSLMIILAGSGLLIRRRRNKIRR